MMGTFSLLWDLYQLKRNEHKNRGQIGKMQNKKLRRLLRYAYDHSVYYRRTFEDAGITRDQMETLPLSSFPVISRNDKNYG